MENSKKKIIIITSLFLGFFLIICVVFIVFNQQSTGVKDTALDNKYIDPGSGEALYDQKSKTPEKYNEDNSIVYLGFIRLVDIGLTNNQLNLLKIYFNEYSSKRSTAINEISVTVDSVNQNIDVNTGKKYITSEITINRKDKYNMQLNYQGINDLNLVISDTSGTQLYNSIN